MQNLLYNDSYSINLTWVLSIKIWNLTIEFMAYKVPYFATSDDGSIFSKFLLVFFKFQLILQ